MDALNAILRDPQYHDLLAIIKGTKNGIWYGAKLRFCHALVMSFLFRKGPAKARLLGILKSTREHAKALGTFVFLYKSMLYLIKQGRKLRTGHPQMSTVKQIHHHAHAMDAFWAGLVAGYIVFGRNSPSAAGSSIAQQMALYVVSRIILGGAKYITKNYIAHSKTELVHMSNTSWTVLASLSWAIVMYLFRADPSVLQSSMLHSMKYLYIESETWSGLSDFLL